jgi:hypothetical protein
MGCVTIFIKPVEKLIFSRLIKNAAPQGGTSRRQAKFFIGNAYMRSPLRCHTLQRACPVLDTGKHEGVASRRIRSDLLPRRRVGEAAG